MRKSAASRELVCWLVGWAFRVRVRVYVRGYVVTSDEVMGEEGIRGGRVISMRLRDVFGYRYVFIR